MLYGGPRGPRDKDSGESTPSGDLLQAPDAFYLPGGAGWVRVDAKTFACEWLPVDEAVYRAGQFGGHGVSGRYGTVAWGKEFCRLVIARERPPGALEDEIPRSTGHRCAAAALGRRAPDAVRGNARRHQPVPHWGSSPPARGDSDRARSRAAGNIGAVARHGRAAGFHGGALRAPAAGTGAPGPPDRGERDGLGLSTRDQTLQEPVPAGAAELEAQTVHYPRQGLRFRVGRRGDANGPFLINHRIPIGNDSGSYAEALRLHTDDCRAGACPAASSSMP